MKEPYLVLEIVFASVFLYGISFGLYKLRIVSRFFHRKIWNYLLLLTFIVSALLGLFLAIQINYRIEIQGMKKLLDYHVNFGIGLVIAGLIHLSWHFKYYFSRNSIHKQKPESGDKIKLPTPEPKLKPSYRYLIILFVLGFITIISQLIFMREYFVMFRGNELTIGITLANWMLFTGLGAYWGRHATKISNRDKAIHRGMFFLVLFPPAGIFLLYLVKSAFFPFGTDFSLVSIYFISLIFLLPYCIFSGYYFTLAAYWLSEKYGQNLIATAYGMEAIGSLSGGLLFSLLLIFILDTFKIMALLIVIGFIAIILSDGSTWRKKIMTGIALLIPALVIFFLNMEVLTKSLAFPGQEVVFTKDTPRGNVVVTKNENQFNIYENGLLLLSSNNIIEQEESVHYPLMQPTGKRDSILVISGGFTGLLDEVLKYEPLYVDYIESNRWIVPIAREYMGELPQLINLVKKDPRLFLQEAGNIKYDAILLNLPEPHGADINRYYTAEFFSLAKTRLSPGGVLSFSLQSPVNYLNTEMTDLHSITMNTLQSVFENTIVITGDKNYYISSDGDLSLELSSLAEKYSFNNEYVNEYYIDDFYLMERGQHLIEQIKSDAGINHDFQPVSYLQEMKLWLNQYKLSYIGISILILVLFFFIYFRQDHLSSAMFVGGFAGAVIEFILIFGFQIVYGYVYYMATLFIAIFMLGIYIGTKKIIIRKASIQNIQKILLTLMMLSVIIPLAIKGLNIISSREILVHLVFFFLILFTAWITGVIFRLSVQHDHRDTMISASGTYSTDSAGAATGMLLVTFLLLPLGGLWAAVLTPAVLSFVSVFRLKLISTN